MASPHSELFSGVVPFVTAARAKSFRLAAQQLGLTPSAVSKAISKLESELGVRLLQRTSRSVALTEEGASFLAACQSAMEGVQAARERLADMQRAPRGTLTLSMPLLLGKAFTPHLKHLLEANPGLNVSLNLSDRFVNLREEGIDVAVRIGAPQESSLTMRKVRTLQWRTVAAPSYLARYGLPESLTELGKHNCLKFRKTSGAVQDWLFATQAQPAAPVRPYPTRGNLISDDGGALINAALDGLGLFQAHDYAVDDLLRTGRLVEVLRAFAASGPELFVLIAPGKRGSAKVRAFVQLLLHSLAMT